MTHHEVKILEDGTRVYSNYTRYRPLSDEERKRGRNKPDVEGAVLFHSLWFVPIEMAPEDDRQMPETLPDTIAYDHMVKGRKCTCAPCQRPSAKKWQDKWRTDHGLKS